MEAQPSADPRPIPAPDDVSGFYWNAAAEQRLVLQRCRSCHSLQYPPEVCCQRCQQRDFEQAEVSGRGVIYSYAVIDRPLHHGFRDALPYVVVLVELNEQPGLRVLANLIDIPEGAAMSCGLPVEVVYEERRSITLPQFRLSEAA